MCVGKYLSVFMGTLFQVLGQHLLRRFGSYGRQAARKEIVVGVTRLYRNDVVGIAQILYVFFQNYFHGRLSSSYYFIKSVTNGRMAR